MGGGGGANMVQVVVVVLTWYRWHYINTENI